MDQDRNPDQDPELVPDQDQDIDRGLLTNTDELDRMIIIVSLLGFR